MSYRKVKSKGRSGKLFYSFYKKTSFAAFSHKKFKVAQIRSDHQSNLIIFIPPPPPQLFLVPIT